MVVLKGYKKRSATNFNKVEPVALYRSLTLRFLPLCLPNSSFRAFCRSNSVDQSQMRQVLKSEFQNIKTLPGYCCVNSRLYTEIYERFKQLCAQGCLRIDTLPHGSFVPPPLFLLSSRSIAGFLSFERFFRFSKTLSIQGALYYCIWKTNATK